MRRSNVVAAQEPARMTEVTSFLANPETSFESIFDLYLASFLIVLIAN